MSNKRSVDTCSFCDKKRKEVFMLIAGKDGFICDECVLYCADVVKEDLSPSSDGKSKPKKHVPSPQEIYKTLND